MSEIGKAFYDITEGEKLLYNHRNVALELCEL